MQENCHVNRSPRRSTAEMVKSHWGMGEVASVSPEVKRSKLRHGSGFADIINLGDIAVKQIEIADDRIQAMTQVKTVLFSDDTETCVNFAQSGVFLIPIKNAKEKDGGDIPCDDVYEDAQLDLGFYPEQSHRKMYSTRLSERFGDFPVSLPTALPKKSRDSASRNLAPARHACQERGKSQRVPSQMDSFQREQDVRNSLGIVDVICARAQTFVKKILHEGVGKVTADMVHEIVQNDQTDDSQSLKGLELRMHPPCSKMKSFIERALRLFAHNNSQTGQQLCGQDFKYHETMFVTQAVELYLLKRLSEQNRVDHASSQLSVQSTGQVCSVRDPTYPYPFSHSYGYMSGRSDSEDESTTRESLSSHFTSSTSRSSSSSDHSFDSHAAIRCDDDSASDDADSRRKVNMHSLKPPLTRNCRGGTKTTRVSKITDIASSKHKPLFSGAQPPARIRPSVGHSMTVEGFPNGPRGRSLSVGEESLNTVSTARRHRNRPTHDCTHPLIFKTGKEQIRHTASAAAVPVMEEEDNMDQHQTYRPPTSASGKAPSRVNTTPSLKFLQALSAEHDCDEFIDREDGNAGGEASQDFVFISFTNDPQFRSSCNWSPTQPTSPITECSLRNPFKNSSPSISSSPFSYGEFGISEPEDDDVPGWDVVEEGPLSDTGAGLDADLIRWLQDLDP